MKQPDASSAVRLKAMFTGCRSRLRGSVSGRHGCLGRNSLRLLLLVEPRITSSTMYLKAADPLLSY